MPWKKARSYDDFDVGEVDTTLIDAEAALPVITSADLEAGAGSDLLDEASLRPRRGRGGGLALPLALGAGLLLLLALGAGLLFLGGSPGGSPGDSSRAAAQRFVESWAAGNESQMLEAMAPQKRSDLATNAAVLALGAVRVGGGQFTDLQYDDLARRDGTTAVRVRGRAGGALNGVQASAPFAVMLDTVKVDGHWYVSGAELQP